MFELSSFVVVVVVVVKDICICQGKTCHIFLFTLPRKTC